jgi:hypothetical protein
MIRKHNDSVKAGCGVDGREGETWTKDHAFNDMNLGYPGNREVDSTDDIKGRKVRNSPGYAAYTSDDDAGLRRADDFEHSAGSRQIWLDVEANQNPDGEFDTTGGIRSGVNRSQS